MKEYWHSVILEEDFCNGCTYCLDRCPTQAIRVKNGKARIIAERCIDCGECLKVCPYHAKGALTDSLSMLSEYKYNIALPAISMYGQYDKKYDINKIFNGFYNLGFDYVFDVAYAADIISKYQLNKIKSKTVNGPIISTFCPAITRLIQIRYPSLIDNICKVESPMEVAARIARKKVKEETKLTDDEIGVFYITQCPAKITSIKNPIGIEKSNISGAISIESVFTKLLRIYDDIEVKSQIRESSGTGIEWAMVGGQSYAMGIDNYLAVDGIEEVIKVLDKIEMGKLKDVDFLEGYACVTGCSGGPLNVENPFIAKSRIRKISNKLLENRSSNANIENYDENILEWNKEIKPIPVLKLDNDFKKAIVKMGKIEEIYRILPGIDCGACGSPTCRALAEDIVLGRSKLSECVVLKRKEKK
ncbi:[Fe-Fe] hydrogenase large subunit C-terminal domain-containing protein [Helicovermis profundi]|uniref:[Fe-Fe] hydrogenase large subunit C-terminal domain-containing protein n=1 Tax=Helicovermis profundi TaxID=3065157 RepID=A0AAU9ED04_9FIRM|nr:[Fe-Fe] hydrogenase large subunit C-terminal domain-containing protein [Clostridia bacterium S502]